MTKIFYGISEYLLLSIRYVQVLCLKRIAVYLIIFRKLGSVVSIFRLNKRARFSNLIGVYRLDVIG